jgi:septal ring factor EnvC (AmiA/AmiB activator)
MQGEEASIARTCAGRQETGVDCVSHVQEAAEAAEAEAEAEAEEEEEEEEEEWKKKKQSIRTRFCPNLEQMMPEKNKFKVVKLVKLVKLV